MIVRGFDPRYIKMCYAATLGTLGYRTRVSLANGTAASAPLADDLHVSLEAFDGEGHRIGAVDPFAVIRPGDFTVVEIDDHAGPGRDIDTSDPDLLVIFHMTPGRFRERSAVDIELSTIFDYVAVSDEYIEYHSDRMSVAAGLAYQSVPLNDERFGGTRTTLMQSPKLLVDEHTDTHLILLNVSTSPAYNLEIAFDLALIAADGSRLANHRVRIPAFGFRRVSMREVLAGAGALERFIGLGGNGLMVGFSDGGSVVPLSVTRDDRSGGLACDHTLPPVYYLPWWGGAVRRAANERIRAMLFEPAGELAR